MPLRGTIPAVYTFKHTRPCKHIHVSGRKCGNRVPKKDMYGKAVKLCELHRGDCLECQSMMRAFGLNQQGEVSI